MTASVKVQAGRCFYCRRPMGDGLAVDHFIPWPRYPRDLGHNFVLTHLPATIANVTCSPRLSIWSVG